MRLVVHVNAAVCEMLVLHYYYLYLFGAIYHGKQSIFFPGGKYNIAVIYLSARSSRIAHGHTMIVACCAN